MASAHGNGRQSRRRPAAGDIESLYRALSAELSPTGWWPADTTFEIMVGAVLTQNTAWGNVDRSLAALKAESMLDPHALTVVEPERLQELIRPSGFYVNKSKTLRSLSRWYVERCDASPEGADGITDAELRAEVGIQKVCKPVVFDDPCYLRGKADHQQQSPVERADAFFLGAFCVPH
mgnify:CR=1 FL=1